MKKLIAATLMATSLLSTQALAEGSGLYVGVDVTQNSNTFTFEASNGGSVDADLDSGGFKLKIGTVSDNGWRFQGYYENTTYDETLFDASHDTLNEIGFDVIKGFEITPEFTPFIQVGLGYGWMEVDGYSEESINEFSLKAGAGLMYKIVPAFELVAGVDFQYRGWQDIESYSTTVSISESTTKLYAGANFHF